MAIRPTGLSTYYTFKAALGRTSEQNAAAAERVATNKRINRPSDDPEGAKMVLAYRQNLERFDQYARNLQTADRYLKQTETALSEAKDILVKAKELALQGRNSTYGNSERAAIADEIAQLTEQLLQVANTKVGDNYIFGGVKTDSAPFELNPGPVATFAGSNALLQIEINEGAKLDVQVDGEDTFKGDGSPSTADIFQTLVDLEAALRAGNLDDTTGVGAELDSLDAGLNQVLSQITTLGARSNRVENTISSLETQKLTLTEFVAQIEDIDPFEAAYELSRTTTALQSALASAGTVLRLPTLFDFIGR